MNLVLFLLFNVLDRRSEQLIAECGVSALAYYQRYPYLELKAPLDGFLDRRQSPVVLAGVSPGGHAANVLDSSATQGLAVAEISLRSAQQRELDSRVERFAQATDRINAKSFGFVPHENKWSRLVTYQFMHRGWVHLLGNLLFLWLVGCKIEDAWGRRQFALLYVSAGVVAALSHKFLAWDSSIALLGASGAIAGVMGAFLFRYAQTKLFSPSTILIRRIRSVPVFLIFGLWFLGELVGGLSSSRGASGVAHFAHLGGFAYGLIIAFARRNLELNTSASQRLSA